MSVSVSVIRLLLAAGAASGVDREQSLADSGITEEELSHAQGRISLERYNELHDLVIARSSDPAIGLHMGETASVSALQLIGYLFMNCRTLEQAIGVFIRYHHIISDCSDPVFSKQGDRAELLYDYPRGSAAANRARAEFGLTLVLRIAQELLGRALVPLEVRFEHDEPAYVDEYRRIFHGTPLLFGQSGAAVVMPVDVLEEIHPHSDRSIYQVLEQQADRLLASLRETGLKSQIRRLIVEQYHGIRPDMQTMAARFHTSPRSLRRRLKEENTNYSLVADEAVFEVARQRLKDPDLSIQQLSFDLGFSEPSAFHRAFRRWSGMTPLQYRLRA